MFSCAQIKEKGLSISLLTEDDSCIFLNFFFKIEDKGPEIRQDPSNGE